MDASAITSTTIVVSGTSKPVNFNSLSLNERMIDVNSFSFSWVPEEVEATFSEITVFKNKNLGQAVTISFLSGSGSPNHVFQGFISQINSSITDDLSTSFQVSGMGTFCTLTERMECRSFLEKTISEIVKEVNPGGVANMKVSIKGDSKHTYIVQYNQSAFEFMRMLAIRYGQWMYFDGKQLVFGDKPAAQPVKLDAAKDLDNISIHASSGKATPNAFAFDMKKGEMTTSSAVEAAPSGSDFLKLADQASDKIFKSKSNGIYIPTSQTQERLDAKNKLNQQRTTAGNVFVSATSHNSTLSVGSVIAITDKKKVAQNFIIIEISHSANNSHGYVNNFTAIPLEAAVPNYTNPHFYAKATPQPAHVVENVDKEGLDRITVRFPWMSKNEATPWIPVLTPYAGKDKGMRWLPEVSEEVMIDFLDNNAERPVMMGAFFTEKNKSSIPNTNNTVKQLSSRDGRMLQLDDANGTLRLYDNFVPKTPKNGILYKRKDSEIKILVESQKDENNYSVIQLDNGDSCNLGLVVGGDLVAEIKLEKNKKITIHAKGGINIRSEDNIDINSQKDISISGANISINASQELKMDGTAKGVKLSGQKIAQKATTTLEIEATASLKLSGLTTTVQGNTQVELKGGAMASVTAALVKIN